MPPAPDASTPRRLLVVRHAKSSWSSGASSDHERPLNGRGRRDAPRVAQRLAELGWVPDAVWSSDALRTRETWEGMRSAFEPEPPVTFDPALYHGGLGALRSAASRWDGGWRTVLALGHNPGWEEAASVLSGRELALSTCNAVLLEGAGSDWSEALQGGWRLVELLRPKEL